MTKESDHQQLEQGLMTACAVRVAEATEMRADAMVLLLLAVAQAVMAMAALADTCLVATVCAQIQSIPMAWKLLDVLVGMVDLAIGHCHAHGTYHQVLFLCYINITASFALLFIYGVVVALRVQV